MNKAYLIRFWDDMASSMCDWENESIALSLEKAKEEQERLRKRGYKTNVVTMKLIGDNDVTV